MTRRTMFGARARAAATHDPNAELRTRAKATERGRKLDGREKRRTRQETSCLWFADG